MPELKDAFSAFRDMTAEDLIKSHVLRTHSKKVMDILDQVITQMNNHDGKIEEMLEKLGRNHRLYGATNDFLYVSCASNYMFGKA